MAEGAAVLDSWIARLRELPKFADRAAGEVAPVLEQELLANVANGVGPDGQAWPLTQDGRVALQGARRGLTVRAVGSVVVARLEGIYARHHRGAVRGGVRRPILPSGKTPATIVRAVREVVTREFQRTMRGES